MEDFLENLRIGNQSGFLSYKAFEKPPGIRCYSS
jgi:hypothetical protein